MRVHFVESLRVRSTHVTGAGGGRTESSLAIHIAVIPGTACDPIGAVRNDFELALSEVAAYVRSSPRVFGSMPPPRQIRRTPRFGADRDADLAGFDGGLAQAFTENDPGEVPATDDRKGQQSGQNRYSGTHGPPGVSHTVSSTRPSVAQRQNPSRHTGGTTPSVQNPSGPCARTKQRAQNGTPIAG
jgi:hypothetical protein